MLGSGATLGTLEQAMRAALAASGARLLQAVLDDGDDGYAGPRAKCAAGHQANYAGSRPRAVTTVLGPLRLSRAWYHCAACKRGFAPRDRQLGLLPGGSLSPGLAEMTALAGAEVSFARAAALIAGLAGITLSARTIERSAEATGAAARSATAAEASAITARAVVPPPAGAGPGHALRRSRRHRRPRPRQRDRRAGGQVRRRPAGTREVKLARLFTVSRLDQDGRPVTDPGSSTYAFSFDGKDALAALVKAEYLRRGGEHFRQVVAIGDGAAWIWGMAEDLYPQATHITDIYHAREHLHDLAAHLAFITPDPPQWLAERSEELDAGNVEAIITAARHYPLAGVRAKELERKLGYFERNAHRMRYQHFRNLGMFIGSGHIEGAIKAVVVQRAKQSGMHWSVEGASSIIARRTHHASGRWDELWPASATGTTQLPTAV